jgi:putative ATP-dependent endonuclease of OLD family
LVVLRSVGRETKARASIEADLRDEEWNDIERYLDATRAEFVFARRVLLVEGYAEQVLIPALAASQKIDLDKVGLSVCGVHGTHFGAYARFLEALGIPWAIVTDGDPDDDGDRLGVTRAQRVLKRLGKAGDPSSSGIFVGEDTLEYDLYRASPANANAVRAALRDLGGSKSKKTVGSWEATPPDCDDLMVIVRRVGGKGRVAQRLSTSHLDAPDYIDDAFAYLLAT